MQHRAPSSPSSVPVIVTVTAAANNVHYIRPNRPAESEPTWRGEPSEPVPLDSDLAQDLIDKGSSKPMAERLVDSIRSLLRGTLPR